MQIIGLSGKARSGKGVFAKIAQEQYGATIISFAAGVKEEVADFLRRAEVKFEPRHLYGGQEDKEDLLEIDIVVAMKLLETFSELRDFATKHGTAYTENMVIKFTPRSLMQWWGTDYRRAQCETYWTDKALAKCTDFGAKLYVIDDCRFKNEAEAIKSMGGLLVRIDRPDAPKPSNPNHPSEVDLDDYEGWDAMIENSGSIETYEAMVEFLLDSVCAYDDLERA